MSDRELLILEIGDDGQDSEQILGCLVYEHIIGELEESFY